MTFSAHAILARFKGDVIDAIVYCEDIAVKYPHLKKEYAGYITELAKNNVEWRSRHETKRNNS